METTNEQSPSSEPSTSHEGGCHCGALRFEVALAADLTASRCNCSVCTKTAVSSSFAKPSAFKLLTPDADLGEYVWGGKISLRFFCKRCGVHCFARGHLEELGGDYVSVNVNCLDRIDPNALKINYWDGRHNNWHSGPRDVPWPI